MSDYYASGIPEYFGHRPLTAGEMAVVDRMFGGWADDFSALPTEGDGFTFSDHSVTSFAASAFLAGWVAARIAEPTETEIDATARAMAARNADSTAPEDVDVEFSQWRRDKYLLDAKAALLAARKAVTE